MNVWREVASNATGEFKRMGVYPIGYDFTDFAGDTDMYYGLWGYDRRYDDLNATGRVIDHIVLDLDTQDTSLVKRVINRIEKEGCEYLLYFSGRGFHVVIPNVWDFGYTELKNGALKHTVLRHFPEADPSCFDSRRVIRMPGTINSKTGLYKYLLAPTNLDFGYDIIAQFGELGNTHIFNEKLPERIGTAFQSWHIVYSQHKPLISVKKEVLMSPKCIHSFLQASPEKGQRHLMSLRIASHLIHYVGLTPTMAHALIMQWLAGEPDMSDQMSREMFNLCNNVADKPYRFGCNDPLLKASCQESCSYFKGKDYMGRFISLKSSFIDYKKRIDNGEYWDLNHIIPIGKSFTVFNDDLLGIIGSQGVGKSALAMDIILRLSHDRPGTLTWYINIDTSDGAMARRAVQWEAKLTKEQVFGHLTSMNKERTEIALDFLDSHIKFSNHRDIEEIDAILHNPVQHGLPKKPDIVVVDHVGNLSSNLSGYDRMRHLGEMLKELPKRHNALFIGIGHVRKADYYNNDLTIASARDANLGESSDVLLGVHARGQEVKDGDLKEKENNEVKVISLKARDNQPFEVDMVYNYDYFTFEPKGKEVA